MRTSWPGLRSEALNVEGYKMRIETTEQAEKLGLGDASLSGILWSDNGRELAIRMKLADGSSAELTFSWFLNLKINLDFKELTQSLTWDVVFSKNHEGTWHVAFDFGGIPDGVLELDCNDVDFDKI